MHWPEAKFSIIESHDTVTVRVCVVRVRVYACVYVSAGARVRLRVCVVWSETWRSERGRQGGRQGGGHGTRQRGRPGHRCSSRWRVWWRDPGEVVLGGGTAQQFRKWAGMLAAGRARQVVRWWVRRKAV